MLLVDLGFRVDRDQLLGQTNMSPRGAFGWSPPGVKGIRFSGGFARIFDPSDLRLFVRPLDQYQINAVVPYEAAGSASPTLQIKTAGQASGAFPLTLAQAVHHKQAAEGYARSGIARSFGVARAGSEAARTPPGKFHHTLTEQDFAVSRRGGKLI